MARKQSNKINETSKTENNAGPIESNKISVSDLIDSIFQATQIDSTKEHEKFAKNSINKYLQQCIEDTEVSKKYNIIFIYDDSQMMDSDTDNIYTAVTKFTDNKPILLVLHSSGGYISPAYLIGKLLHEYSNHELDIVIPRRAKSAATLLCCAADRIHMGSLSELGPIDPQIEGLPALGLKSSIEHIAALVKEHPYATDLLAKYMSQTIQPIHLGYYERVAESAVQYAEKLMEPHKEKFNSTPESIAKQLVYSYKDHGFVIDKQEALRIFGDKFCLHNTVEYQLGNSLYQRLNFIKSIFNLWDFQFYFVGSTNTGSNFSRRKPRA